ncbi:MAG: adenylate/guanylate cyclase domain-containing protein [Acetobacteraceae bacterium]|nr:adenylate/guanylate cyclase domain-containing protein [Acetobacteraceae bacterium]
MAQQAGAAQGTGPGTTRSALGVVAATVAVSAVGMAFVVAAALAVIFADLEDGIALGLTAFGVVLGLNLAVWIGRRVARSLVALTREAEAMRALETGPVVPVASGLAELDRLGDAMRQMKHALGVFGVYIPRDLVRQLLSQGTEIRLGGERRQVTVMFSDIEDFTRIAEGMEPEELMRMVSGYFELVTAELLHSGATIDKYIGDAVMALWNAPRRDLAHALHGCHGVLRARLAAEELADRLVARGKPRFRTRFGLHSGQAVVGNVGSSDRMNYTAIGATVNLASRLEALNRIYGTQILASEATLRGAGGSFVFRAVDLVMPKGTGEAVAIHELIGLGGARNPEDAPLVVDRGLLDRLPAWEEMIRCYRAARFEAASAALTRFGGATADSLAALYAGRIAALRAAPPEPGWTPVVGYDQK